MTKFMMITLIRTENFVEEGPESYFLHFDSDKVSICFKR